MAKKLYDEDGNVVKGAKVKKPFYKRWWFIALVAIVIIGALGSGDEDESVEVSEPETEEVEIVEETETEEVKEKPEPKRTKSVPRETEEVEEFEEIEVADLTEEEELQFEEDFMITLSENMAIEHFEGVAEVHYSEEENGMVFLPIDEDFTIALGMIEAGLLDKSEWNVLRDNFVDYSSILSEFTGDENILVYVANPANPDKYILIANNGQIIYDVFNE